MLEGVQLQREKDAYIKSEEAKASEYFKNQEAEEKKKSEASQTQVKEITSKIENWHKDLIKANDWLQQKEIPANATADERAQIEDSNKFSKQVNALLLKSLNVRTVEEGLEVAFDSVRYYQSRREAARLADENAKLKSQLKERDDQIVKIRTSSRTTPRKHSTS